MKKKIMSLLMVAALTIAMTVPVYADWDYTGATEDGSGGYYGGTYSGSGASDSAKVLITATKGSTYTVVLPASVSIGQSSGWGNVFIGCYGNITGDEKVSISIPKSFTMTHTTNACDPVTGTAGFDMETAASDTDTSKIDFIDGTRITSYSFATGEMQIGHDASESTLESFLSPSGNRKGGMNATVSCPVTVAGSYTGTLTVTFGLSSRS